MIAALFAWAAALAVDLASAPGEAHAALGGLFIGGVTVLTWGLLLESRERVSRRRWRAAARVSRVLFAAAGARKRYRLP